jgi:hypothetical protein
MQACRPKSVVLVALLASCAGGAPRPAPAHDAATEVVGELTPAKGPEDASVPADAVAEAVARRLIGERLRAHGLRVLHDENVAMGAFMISLDGFDPERLVGFEYVDQREREALQDLPRGMWRRQGQTILVVDATNREGLAAAVDRLVALLPKMDAGP